MKNEIVNIIIERRLRGKDIPLWIRWLFPNIVKEVDPIVRMLKGDKAPKKQKSTFTYQAAYTLAIILLFVISSFIILPYASHQPAKQEVKTYNMSKTKQVKGIVGDTKTPTTATTSSNIDKHIKELIKPKPKCHPGQNCITDPVIPPPLDQ